MKSATIPTIIRNLYRYNLRFDSGRTVIVKWQSALQILHSLFLRNVVRYLCISILLLSASCQHTSLSDPLVAIQIQDRNGLTETISAPERLENYEGVDFFTSQPYKKILRIYRTKGKSHSKITTYHPNGSIWQYLEAEELRAHGAYREWYANGQLKIEAILVGGTADVAQGAQRDWLFDGVSRVWNEQGGLIAQIPYKQGALEGISLYYTATGSIEKQIPYHNNTLEGVAVEYYPNGKIRAKTSYLLGEKQGSSFGYFQNDQISWEEEYTDNLLLKGSYYNAKGELLSKVDSGSGFRALFEGESLSLLVQIQQGFAEGGVKQFTNKGELQASYHVKNGKKIGEEVVYFLSQEREDNNKTPHLLKYTVNWEDNAIHGSVKTWYNNGQLQSQRDYCRNKRSGPSLAWYRDGSLMLIEEYEEEKLMKGQYYKKNAMDAVSSVLNGSGIATLYDEFGIYLRKIPYVKGDPVDPED